MAEQNGAIKKRRQDPETRFFLAVHDLFSEITDNPEPGFAGPLHRFTKNCAALIDAGIAVPKKGNFFQKRLTAALAGEPEKINVFPRVVFPGKWRPRNNTVSPLDLSERDPLVFLILRRLVQPFTPLPEIGEE